ncbi:D-hexose-6-phosphate mutarotase [Bowmanella denitrificans]|uniref:D-hexose-6-phosphate mutarotase n=1 Tax=Bowmanella denitrificans TaxID=366582 RepID=UPI000C9C1738|nr:D-hexose-6-phosphate mutarotase [Bowmanella denitrificans]
MKLSTHVFQRTSDQGMPIISVDNPVASLELSLFGGHVLSFMPKRDNRQRLWLSPKAVMDGSKPIRGGIPLCWPWFGQASQADLPAHGLVRNQMWQVIRVDDDVDETRLQLQPKQCSGPGFVHSAELTLELLIGHQLSVSLITRNTGQQAFTFGGALHSYFRVSDIGKVKITGLQGPYQDKVQNTLMDTSPSPYCIAAETDRIHLTQSADISIVDAECATQLHNQGHDSLVVWNPWQEKSAHMADMPANGYQQMLCIEAAITQGLELAPGQSHTLKQVIA